MSNFSFRKIYMGELETAYCVTRDNIHTVENKIIMDFMDDHSIVATIVSNQMKEAVNQLECESLSN